MFNISQFFKRVQHLQSRRTLLVGEIQKTFKKYAGIDVPAESISLKKGEITLKNVPHSLRTAIYIKKQAILADMNAMQDVEKISDIR